MCGWRWRKPCLGHGPAQISGAALLPPLPASEAKSLPLSQHLICFPTWTQKKGQALTLQVSAVSGNKPHQGGERKNPLNVSVGVRARFVLWSSSTGWVSLPALHTLSCFLLPNSSAQPIPSDLCEHPLPHGAAMSAKRDLGTQNFPV